MWILRNLLFILRSKYCVSGAAPLIHVSGYEGRDVKVSCPYGEGYESYEKYLCRNDCGNDDDVLIMTTQANKNKYSISDDINKRVLTTTISDLSSVDAGKYWCGVTRFLKDYYPAEVRLDVVPGKQTNKIKSEMTTPQTAVCLTLRTINLTICMNTPFSDQHLHQLQIITLFLLLPLILRRPEIQI
uniref:Immunoglobulin V-set domain-containing protein n=1 Tax=Seriola lalandi dorsalis TaxID=1841481 RepID=A0A3B4Y0G2_SERLL